MGEKVSPAYRILRELPEGALRREAALLVDLVVDEELSVGPLEEIPALPGADPVRALLCWRLSIAAAHPRRSSMQLVLSCFPDWLRKLDGRPACAPFLLACPAIASAAGELGVSGVTEVLDAAAECAGEEDARVVLEAVASYSDAFRDIIVGIARISRAAAHHVRVDLLQRLEALLPLEQIAERGDSRKFIPALARMSDAYFSSGPVSWRRAIEVVLAVLESSVSSARSTAEALTALIPRLEAANRESYLEDFGKLIARLGTQAVGQALGSLPDLYAKHGREASRRFVEAVCDAADQFGANAGQHFLEQKTRAAREFFNAAP